jgi:hypothetical protein
MFMKLTTISTPSITEAENAAEEREITDGLNNIYQDLE